MRKHNSKDEGVAKLDIILMLCYWPCAFAGKLKLERPIAMKVVIVAGNVEV